MSTQESAPAAEPVVEAAPAVEATEPVVTVDVGPVTVGEPVITEPVEGEPVIEAPVVEVNDDPFHTYGGKDTVEAATRLYEASRTEDGVIQLFIEAGRSLGLGLKEIEALFTGAAPAAEGEPEPEFDPDEPLTYGAFQEMQRKQAEAAAAQQAAAAQATAKEAVRTTVEALGLDPADPATKVILQFGDNHIKGDFSPENVAKAVRQGHADYLAQVERDAQAYLQKKAAQAAAVPQAPAGTPAASPAPVEPMNTSEAIKLARQRMKAATGT